MSPGLTCPRTTGWRGRPFGIRMAGPSVRQRELRSNLGSPQIQDSPAALLESCRGYSVFCQPG
jgi:hypothetical protein